MKKNGFKRILAGFMAFSLVFSGLTVPEVHAEEPAKTETEVHSIEAASMNSIADIDASYFTLSGEFTFGNTIETEEGDVSKNNIRFASSNAASVSFATKGVSTVTVDAGCVREDSNSEFTLLDAEGNAVLASYSNMVNGLVLLTDDEGHSAYDLAGNASNVYVFDNLPEGTYTLTSLALQNRKDVLLYSLSVSSTWENKVENAPEVSVKTEGKIDAFDFGAEKLDESVYNNILTEDVINSWYADVDAGTTGKNLASFEVKDNNGNVILAFNDGGFATTHRLRSVNKNITRYDDKSLKDTNGNVAYNGYIYSNKSKTSGVYVSVLCQAGDIVKVYAASNGTDSEVVFENMNNASDKQSFVHTLGSSVAGEYTYYAKESGMYKIYSATEKLVAARILVKHCPEVSVSGTVSVPEGLSDFSLVFSNDSTGSTVSVPVVNGHYEASLASNYTYTVSLSDANGYIVAEGDKVTVSNSSMNHDVTVLAVTLVTVSGELMGDMTDKAFNDASISFVAADPEKVYVPVIEWSGRNFIVSLEKDVVYNVVVEGVDDYESQINEIAASEDCVLDLRITLKDTYKVNIEPVGAELSDLSDAVFTFVRHSDSDVTKEEAYVYTFTGTDNIALRNGVYTVKVKANDYKQKLTSNLLVNCDAENSEVTKTIAFEYTGEVSDYAEWNFTGDDYNGQDSFEGLTIVNGKKHGAQYGMMIKNGTIEIPVGGDSKIEVTVGYTWDISLNDGEAVLQTTDGGVKTLTFDYEGKAGVATLKAGADATSYIAKITVSAVSSDKVLTEDVKLTVGADGCDYTTINDALSAVRKMNRADGQRVVIEIQPGNYEEMLVIDVPNVSLVNANANPSIKPVNKGVDIEASSVRITSYYGHGYTYYSMDSNCKYDEEILSVNKENGYPSFVNPGSGTTNGSYWNATVSVKADGFEAEGIIFENSFNQYVSAKAANDVIVAQSTAKEGSVARASMKEGDTTVQDKKYVERAAALAIYNNVNKVSFDNCAFIGRQDTLYGGSNVTAAFYGCDVYGGTDYIFGGMTAVFAKCNLVANTMEDGNDVFYITAPQQKSGRGYLMYNCNVVSTEPGVNTASATVSKPGEFGRPWEANTSEVVFYATNVGESTEAGLSLIKPEGWLSTLSSTSDNIYEFGTNELSGADNFAKRADWTHVSDTIEGAVLADNTEVSVEAFLGNWDAFAGKDMTIVLEDKIEHPVTEPEEPELPEGATTVSTTYTLDAAADLTAFAAGAKKDGEEEKAGTDNYFTVIYSAKSKVDSSSKSFEDGYSSSQRINLGGKAETGKNAVKFTTAHKNAVVKVWWVEGGDDNRQMTILDKDGVAVATTDITIAKNAVAISEFTLEEAGTYYIGGSTNNNYIFKLEVTESVSYVYVEHEYTLDATADLTAFAAGAKKDGDEEKAGTDNYFTNIYSTKSKVDSSSKSFEDGYSATQRINFGGLASTSKNAVKFTTTSADTTVKVWWVEGGDDNRQMTILDKDGVAVATTNVTVAKNAVAISEFKLTEAGTYYLGGATNNNYIFKVLVTEKKLEAVDGVVEEPARKDWAEVEAPTVSAVQKGGAVDVTVNAVVGKDGADYIEVTVYDADGKAADTRKSSKEGESVVISIELTASGKYSFAAKAVREDEETVHVSETASADFVLPLAAPSVKSATNAGAGMVSVAWDSVKEAEEYAVYADGVEVARTAKLTANIDLSASIGKSAAITVKAVRGNDESALSKVFNVTVKNNSEREWGFAAFGSSVSSSKDGFSGSVNDGSVSIWSTGNGGKIVPNSTDGLAFYYTVIDPEKENFTLEADVTVDEWTFSNGQEGFGIMVADAIGKNGDGAAFWNNSIQNIVSKVEYTEAGSKVTMKLGIGALVRLGLTAEDVASFTATGVFPNGKSIPEGFTTETTTLEYSGLALGAGTYNIVGNCTNTPDGTINNITTFHMSIQRNNTGYIIKYSDAEGNVIGEKLVYDIERNALTQRDADHIYAGFFASRNAKITVNNVKLVTIDPADDEAAEEREIEYVDLKANIESAAYANTSDYELVFYTNADGVLSVATEDGTVLADKQAVKANTKAHFNTVLAKESTDFVVTFTPDADFEPGEYKKLTTYETQTLRLTVHTDFNSIGEGNYIYVAPGASDNGLGTNNDPTSIYTAVTKAKPGQTIVLAGGEYSLSRTVTVNRGINGTKEAPVYMISNPKDANRAVLNFNGKCAGMVLAGDYWYFKGFDVTGSLNGQKGIQVSGSNNVLDDLRTYRNGNTGIQISRFLGTDKNDQWPSNNLILNCTSFLNADKGYEDADGFAAKLTIGEGNVFDGCISAFNADDGWDLFAKAETGPIGKVIIKNSVAFMNGYVFAEDGKLINAGNGNGFKMGGESLSGYHTLINSVAFANKAKGIDSNSCPDIQAYNSVSFDNESYNVAFYTNNAVNTDFAAEGVISFNLASKVAEQLKLKGNQDASKVNNATNYFVGTDNVSVNTEGVKVAADWFVSTDKDAVISEAIREILAGTFGYTTVTDGTGIERNADGTIDMNGFLVLTDKAPEKAGAVIEGSGQASGEIADSAIKATPKKPSNSGNGNNSNVNNNGNGNNNGNNGNHNGNNNNNGNHNGNNNNNGNGNGRRQSVTEVPGRVTEEPVINTETVVTETVENTAEDTKEPVVEAPASDNNTEVTVVPEEETPLAPAVENSKNSKAPVVVLSVVAAMAAASGIFLFLRKRPRIK